MEKEICHPMWDLAERKEEEKAEEDAAEISANVRYLAKIALPLPSFLKRGNTSNKFFLDSKKIKQCYSQKERSLGRSRKVE